MDRRRFGELMAGLASTTHKRFESQEIRFWYRCLSDLPDEALEAAFVRFAMTGDDWPSVAKLRALADEAMHGQFPTAGEAWESVITAVRRYGPYDPARGMAVLSEAAQKALRCSGGWRWACDMTVENRQVMAGQFRRHYEQIVERERSLRTIPEHLRPSVDREHLPATDAAINRSHPAARALAQSLDSRVTNRH
jgi:hypothetical protein